MVIALISLALLTFSASCTAPTPSPHAVPTGPTPAPAPTTDAGTQGWQLSKPGLEHAIEGFADRVSVVPGDTLRLFVSTAAAGFTVTAFRVGGYQRSDPQAVWTSPRQAGGVQAAAVVQKFSSGAQGWVCGMDPACKGKGRVGQVLDAISTRLLQQFAAGPAGTAHPAVDNLAGLGINQAGAVSPPPDNG